MLGFYFCQSVLCIRHRQLIQAPVFYTGKMYRLIKVQQQQNSVMLRLVSEEHKAYKDSVTNPALLIIVILAIRNSSTVVHCHMKNVDQGAIVPPFRYSDTNTYG